MAFGRRVRNIDIDPFTDLLFNALLAFTFLFLVAIMFLNPPAKSGVIDPKAEYIITVKWPDFSEDDLDIWVEDPQGRVVWFRSMSQGFMHLERDDRGVINDTIVVDGREITNPLNQEVVTIRKVVPGEYVVNLHYYQSASRQSVTAEVRVVKVNPKLEVIYYGNVDLQHAGDERTAVRFRIRENGTISSVNTSLAKKLVQVEAR